MPLRCVRRRDEFGERRVTSTRRSRLPKMKVAVTTLAFCVAALLALGLVMLYSSSYDHRKLDQVSSRFLMKQIALVLRSGWSRVWRPRSSTIGC